MVKLTMSPRQSDLDCDMQPFKRVKSEQDPPQRQVSDLKLPELKKPSENS